MSVKSCLYFIFATMLKRLVYLFIVFCFTSSLQAQNKYLTDKKIEKKGSQLKDNLNAWSLEKCVQFARENNLQISAQKLNEKLAHLQLIQSKASRFPIVNANSNLAETYGRSIDPTSNQFVTKGFLYNTLGVQTNTLLFGWFQKKYQIQQNQLDLESTQEAYEQLKDDISLNIATAYLRVLMMREQVKISESQLRLDREQLNQTEQFVNAGKLPELNLAQMFSQLANDSALWVNNQTEEQIAMLQLRAIMNFDFEDDFDIMSPDINMFDINLLDQYSTPANIFLVAKNNQHRAKMNQLKLLSAEKNYAIAKAASYPQLSVFSNLSTNFSTNVFDITGQTYIGETFLGNVVVAGNSYTLTRPEYTFTTATRPILKQYGNNIQANAGIGISFPILNGFVNKTNIERARIGIQSQQLTTETDQQKLQQDIYTAYQQAKAASKKYDASFKAYEAAKRALDFASKRYNIGLMNTFEYTSTQNNFFTTSANLLSAKYDYIFKLKIIDYYMGNPIKL